MALLTKTPRPSETLQGATERVTRTFGLLTLLAGHPGLAGGFFPHASIFPPRRSDLRPGGLGYAHPP